MLRALPGLLAGLLFTHWFSLCLAQDDAVVVTATRFAEDVRRLPASTTVLTADDIARSAARTLPELLQEQVGFNMRDLFGNNAAQTTIDLRGYGATGAQNTLVLIDGRRQNDFDLSGVQWASIPIPMIERIEILRGTGAVLYGDNASAGVVNIVTRSPLKQGNLFEAMGRIGSYETVEGQLYGNYATDHFGINGLLYGYESEGYRANNRNEQQNAALNLRWALGAGALDLRFGIDQQELRLPGARIVQPSIGLDEYQSNPRGAQTPNDYASRDGRRAGAGYSQRFGDAEFSIGLDYRDKDQRSFFEQGGAPFTSYRADKLDLTSITPKLRLPFSTGGVRHSLVVGVDWNDWQYDSRRTNRPENLAQPTNAVSVDQEAFGAYLQDTLQLTATTIATLGWRRERVKYNGTDAFNAAAPGCVEQFGFCTGAAPVAQTQEEDAWEVGLRQGIGAQWAVFGRAGRSFRFVNAEEIYEFDAFGSSEFQILKPQTADTYEAGVEWRRSGSMLRATFFHSDIENEIHLDPFTAGVGNRNLPPSQRRGVELDGKLQVSRTFQLSAGYAYTEAKFKEGVLPGGPFVIGTDIPIGGKTVPLVPENKLNVAFSWDILPRTRLSGALTAVSEQYRDNDEPNTLSQIPAYEIVDLKLAQRFSWGRLSLAVNNLFNQDYYTYSARSQFVADRYAVYPLPGTTVSLTAELFVR
jgi:iron complex outermembrane recepter protein